MENNADFTINLSVRDYECDIQGIVNNAVYQNYCEHARHAYLKHHGFCFHTLTQSGILLVMYRAELHYRKPLFSGDNFQVSVSLKSHTRTRCIFEQRISSEAVTHADGVFHIAALNNKHKPIKLESIGLDTLYTS